MRPRRDRRALERAVEAARMPGARARAHYALALFHDNNAREAAAIPHYRAALEAGLPRATEAACLTWLASSLWKTGHPAQALQALARAERLARDPALRSFQRKLRGRIERSPRRFAR